jgi:hypothetical protein
MVLKCPGVLKKSESEKQRAKKKEKKKEQRKIFALRLLLFALYSLLRFLWIKKKRKESSLHLVPLFHRGHAL